MDEITLLRTAPIRLHTWAIVADALPPEFLLLRALDQRDDPWAQPRLLIDEAQHEVVGSACYKSAPRDGRIEIGYGISALRRHRGLATTAARLMIDEAFRSGAVEEVRATVRPDNTASRRVLEKAGFTICGTDIDDEEGPVEVWCRKRPQPTAPSLGGNG